MMATPATSRENPKVASAAEWLAARKALLSKEKELTRLSDELSKQRREMPWERIEKDYIFDTKEGKKSMAELFEGRSQLIVYHFMLGPDWKEGCPSCSLLADHFDGGMAHLNARDITFVVVSRAPLKQIQAFQERMGWKFKWVSANETDFNYDYHVSRTEEEKARGGDVEYNYAMQHFPADERPGASVFYKDEAGNIFHTYSTYGRGLDHLIGAYNFIDLTPKGRHEEGLAWPMAWVRHHDKYEKGYAVDAHAGYVQPASTAPKVHDKSVGSCCSGDKQ